MTSVLHFLNQVERAYETGIEAQALLTSYEAFKAIVRSKAEEKQIDREFEKVSGYSTYQAVKAARAKEKGKVKLGN